METKPYSLQSPEQIAKDYGGNKQKIAQAAQMGMIDPTAAVMAGMFIDRMRSAQQQEQQPQQTVAQQVFAPPQPPMPPQGAPQGAPPMMPPQGGAAPPPQQGAPMPPQQPPMSMAGGGLLDIAIPDQMYDEPDNMAYAGGGLVAFAGGGEAEDEDDDRPLRSARKVFAPAPGLRERIRREYGVGDRIPFEDSLIGRGVGAVSDVIFGSPEARAEAIRARKEYETAAGAAVQYGRDRNAYGWQKGLSALFGGEVPLHPSLRPLAPATRKDSGAPAAASIPRVTAADMRAALAPGARVPAPSAPAAAPAASALGAMLAPQGGARAAAPQGASPVASAPQPAVSPQPSAPAGPQSIQDYMAMAQQLRGPAEATPYRDRLMASAEAQLDPEAMAARKKQDMWTALAQMGFSMAGTNSPYFMQAVGQAGAATVPAMQAMSKERRADERAAIKQLADAEGLSAAEKRQLLAADLTFAQAQQQLAMRREEFDATMGLEREKFAYAKQSDAADRALRARGGGGGGDAAFKNTPEGQLAASKYAEIMLGKDAEIARRPEIRAAYHANPAAFDARYEASARQRAWKYALETVSSARGSGQGGDAYTTASARLGGGRAPAPLPPGVTVSGPK